MALEPGDYLTTIDDPAETKIGFADDTTRITLKGPSAFQFIKAGMSKRVEFLKGEAEIAVPDPDRTVQRPDVAGRAWLDKGEVRLISKSPTSPASKCGAAAPPSPASGTASSVEGGARPLRAGGRRRGDHR